MNIENVELCINQSTIMECRTEQFLTACSTAGFRSVELRVPKLKETFYSAAPGTVEELLDRYGLRVVALNSIDDFALVPDEYLPLLENELRQVGFMCRAVSCDFVVAPVGRWYDGPLRIEEIFNRSAARLRHAAEVLSDFGVTVGLEPIGFPEFTIREIRTAMTVIDRAAAPNIALVPDVYNLSSGGVGPEQLGPYVGSVGLVHVNDSVDLPKEKRHVMYSRTVPGEGILPVTEWIRVLHSKGYTGPFSLELFDRDLWAMAPEEAAKRCFAKLSHFFSTLSQEEIERC